VIDHLTGLINHLIHKAHARELEGDIKVEKSEFFNTVHETTALLMEIALTGMVIGSLDVG